MAGSNIAISKTITEITTSSSISVKPFALRMIGFLFIKKKSCTANASF